MRRRIFLGIFGASMAVLILSLSMLFAIVYKQNDREYKRNLKNDTYMAAAAVEAEGAGYLSRVKLDDRTRLTLISPKGVVKADTNVSPATMPNHRDRPEVAGALADGYAMDERYSETLSRKSVYCAVRLRDGDVLRMARDQRTVISLLIMMLPAEAAVLLVIVIISIFMAGRISRRIIQPLNQIDMKAPLGAPHYQELDPMLQKIDQQNHALNEQIDLLTSSVEEKEREAEFRKEFTANVSHELKTPLTSISGFAEIIENGIARPEDVRRFAGKIYTESQRLITLVGDIIKLSQMDENEVAARKEEVDLYELAEDCLDSVRPAAEKRGVDCQVLGHRETIEGVPQILEEMVYNLCDNAVKYNRENGTVYVRIGRGPDGPFLEVKDTGIGIPKESQARVFERFYRVDKSHSKEVGGTGLGLSIVKHGAMYHNAKVELDSAEGKGTRIRITFPDANGESRRDRF